MAKRPPGGAKLTPLFEKALLYATHVHSNQKRKGTRIPYVGHLLGVAALVLEDGGDQDQVIAALLHDAVEDQGGRARLDDIRARFGNKVARIVEVCSDSETNDPREKRPWPERKRDYLDHLWHAPASALRVSAADKLHNARAILADYRALGEALWARFNPESGRDNILLYYRSLVDIFRERAPGSLTDELRRVVAELHRVAGAANGTGRAWDRHEEAGGVVLMDGKVLLRKTATGHWIFPKGHVEVNETLEKTAEREVEEETGVRATAGRHVGVVSYTLGDRYYEVHLFAMRAGGTAASWPEHRRHHGLSVARNTPFGGSILPTRYVGDLAVMTIMIETNRHLYLDERTGEKTGGFAETRGLMGALAERVREWLRGRDRP